MFVESQSIEEAPRETTSTDKMEVEVLPHVAEGCVGVLVNNSAVWTEGELPAPSFKVERLPHEAWVTVEVTQQELLVRAYTELRRRDGYQAQYVRAWKRLECSREVLLETLTGIQRDPVCWGGELVRWALHEEAFPPENRQPMFGYYLRKFHLRRRHSRYEAAGVVYVPSGGQGTSLQSQEAAPYALHPVIIRGKDLISLGKDVIPLGRDASRGGGLSSGSSVAYFFLGDEHGLLSSEGHLWPPVTSSLGVETGQPPGKLVTSSSDMTTAAASSEVNAGMVTSRSIASCSNGLSPREGPGTAG